MRKIKNFIILVLVVFLLGGTIYFSLTIQDQNSSLQTQAQEDMYGDVNGTTDKKDNNVLAYNSTTGEQNTATKPAGLGGLDGSELDGTITPTSSATKGGIVSLSPSISPTRGVTGISSPTPTFGNAYPTSSGITALPTSKPLSQVPLATLPVAGIGDDLGKIAVGAGLLIIASFLL